MHSSIIFSTDTFLNFNSTVPESSIESVSRLFTRKFIEWALCAISITKSRLISTGISSSSRIFSVVIKIEVSGVLS